MKQFIVFLAFILICTTIVNANNQVILRETTTVCEDDIIIVVIQPRSDNTHDIEIHNAVGEGVLKIKNIVGEVLFNQGINAPTIKNVDTSNYPSGTYSVEFSFEGAIYSTIFNIE